MNVFLGYCFLLAAPPRIVTHPQEIKSTYGKSVTLTVEAAGTEPLSYMWQHKTGGWIGRWQSCDVERFPGANSSKLTVPSVQKSNEGSYRCVISNCVGSQTSKAAKLEVSWCISEYSEMSYISKNQVKCYMVTNFVENFNWFCVVYYQQL